MFFLQLRMYWGYLNFKFWVIWASVTFLFFQNVVGEFFMDLCVGQPFVHVWEFGLVALTSRLSCAFLTNVCRFLMAPSCVDVGQLASQQGVAWAICMWGVVSGFFLKCFFVGQCVGYFISCDARMGPYFVYVYRVWGPIDLTYYGSYEEFIWVVML